MLAILLTGGHPAAAQSQADLRRENQRLQSRVTDLEAELEAARRRITDLESQIAQLRDAVQAARTGQRPSVPPPPLEEPQVSIDESVPTATPRALMKAVSDGYAKRFEVMPVGQPGDRERIQYLREVRSWVAQVNRELRSPIAWPVRLEQVLGVDRGLVVELQFVDPDTDVRLGRPFLVHLPDSVARRLQHVEQRGDLDEIMVLRGTLVPMMRFNESRVERGAFDNPPMIGPFAEFAFRIDPRTLMPRDEDKAQTSATP